MKAEQLRKSILQMAVQGKLVPQNPNDEPASVLLEKIRAEKQHLVKEGKIKKDKADSVIFKGEDNHYYEKIDKAIIDITDEIEIELPDSWCVCRFSTIANIFTGNSINEQEKAKNYTGLSEGYNYIATKDVSFSHTINYLNGVKIPFDTQFRIAHKGTPLLCIEGGSAGRKIGILDEDVCFGNKLCAFESFGINTKYLYYYLQNPKFIEVFKSNTTGIIGGVSVNILKTLFFFLPPLSEQERIVAEIEKYEPLLTEYNKLEEQATKLDDEIYDKLKKSILQYAIQGKLVEQDDNDEPASVLLERIRAEKKAKLGKKYVDSYIYKGDDNCYYEKVGSIVKKIDDEIPFEIPKNWHWCRLNEIIQVKGGKRIPAGRTLQSENNGFIYIRVTDMKNMTIITDKLMYVPIDIVPIIKQYVIHKDDLYLTIAGTIGSVGIVPDMFDGMNLTENAVKLTDIRINKFYLLWLVKSEFVQKQFMDKTNKVAQPKLAIERILSTLVPIPPLKEQQRIVADLVNVYDYMNKGEI